MPTPDRWYLHADGHRHVVEDEPAGLGRRATWSIDGTTVAERRSAAGRITLTPATDTGIAGSVRLRFGSFGPARRVSWHPRNDPSAAVGLGGRDFTAEAGSRAARRDAFIAAHPRAYTGYRITLAIATLAVALAVGPVVSWFVNNVPWQHLPAIPWPNVQLPDWSFPDWLGGVIDVMKFVVPVLIAFGLARLELRRRRQQRERHRS
ncbi:hypothetical protein QWI29_01785 [Mycolicibacterium neoaurum]|uniref:hypothetical protein n=1 Tax=Mycolicibacterium neoaurum TaxID=1795 RepID=UPI0026731291|nr:hypothetical protein [Mycolicibacterium neoaurum]MDO3398750.1 hypothetical protein [Mycolicibacterium neoaurum]